MKKILLSLSTITAVAILAVVGTTAYFTDTEQSTGNTFTAGTIDIAVDDMNPWSRTAPFAMDDMKPSQVDYTNFTIQNVGTNPANVWKKVSNVRTEENGINEPECAYYQGVWTPGTPGTCIGGTVKNDIDTVITYDLSVVVKDKSDNPIWNQTLYNMNKTIAEINAMSERGTLLGMIPAGGSMDVTESYHMDKNTENWAQSDKMTFDITLTAEQLTGTVILEDKDQDAPWRVRMDTPRQGTLTYGVKDAKFNYSFSAVDMTAGTSYSLIAYYEPFSTPSGGPGSFPRPIKIIGSATANGAGVVTIPQTSVELDTSLLNMPIWLVPTADITGTNITGWSPTNILFETGLMDYYDTDL